MKCCWRVSKILVPCFGANVFLSIQNNVIKSGTSLSNEQQPNSQAVVVVVEAKVSVGSSNENERFYKYKINEKKLGNMKDLSSKQSN